MINLIDSTYRETKDISVEKFIQKFKNKSVTGINWWNSLNFSTYLREFHENPWDILEAITKGLPEKKHIIDVRVNQLSNFITYPSEVLENFFLQLAKNNNIYVKIFDPLNDIDNIKKSIEIACHSNLKIIGGLFLRPDLENYPDCHIDLIKLYQGLEITELSLIEPLGLLKAFQITQIKKEIDNLIPNNKVNLSVKHVKEQVPIIIQEAITSNITEFEFDLFSKWFGLPSLEAVINTISFSNTKPHAANLPINLLEDNEFSTKSDLNQLSNKSEVLFLKFEHETIPLQVIIKVLELKYFTNLEYSMSDILDKIKKIQLELGNPPLVDPFLAIIISQSIFRLQNADEGIQSLDTLKYIAGYWGDKSESLKGQYMNYLSITKNLKQKSNLFKFPIFNVPNNDGKEKLNDQEMKERLLYQLVPEEANFYFNIHPSLPKTIDISKRKNLASLLKIVFESANTERHGIIINEELPTERQNDSSFRWRHLSRLFQMGKF